MVLASLFRICLVVNNGHFYYAFMAFYKQSYGNIWNGWPFFSPYDSFFINYFFPSFKRAQQLRLCDKLLYYLVKTQTTIFTQVGSQLYLKFFEHELRTEHCLIPSKRFDSFTLVITFLLGDKRSLGLTRKKKAMSYIEIQVLFDRPLTISWYPGTFSV